MPIIERSSYPGAPFWQYNGHLQTIGPGLLRRVPGVHYTRERIETPDGDFLDLDWLAASPSLPPSSGQASNGGEKSSRNGHRKLVVLTHGLEGDSNRQYIRGSARLFYENGWDVLAWNCRSCSGEMNRAFRMYHHGDVDDITTVIDHALATRHYEAVSLVGFSMGGNITMKYVGTLGERVPEAVKAAVAFSSPCSLESASDTLDRWDNAIYRKRFMKALLKKLRHKDGQYPGVLDLDRARQVRRWRDFDEWFSAPICGYRDALDFYHHSSARNFVGGTRVPTLLVNAWNDPILTADCMPLDLARDHDYFYLEAPREGGHCGFAVKGDQYTWAERRALAFCAEVV